MTGDNWSNRDDDSMSDIYTTDGTGWVAPESKGAKAGTASTAGTTVTSGAPATVVAADNNKSIFRSSSSISGDSYHNMAAGSEAPSDDDSMSGMSGLYTTDGVSVTQEDRFRASVLAEERKILKEYSLDSGSGSFESYPNGLFMPTNLITAKTPSPNKKQDKNKKQKWSPFVSSVGTNDFDLDSIESESDGIMRGEQGRGLGSFQVLGIKARMAGSPVGTDKTRSPSTLGGGAVLSTSYDDAFPELAEAEGGYAGRSRSAKDTSKAKKKAAAAAAAAAGTSQMRPRVCRCKLEKLICILVGVMMIALAIAIGTLVAAKQTRGGNEEGSSASEFQDPSPSAPTPSGQMPTLSRPATPAPQVPVGAPTSSPLPFGAFPVPTSAPSRQVVTSTKGPTSSPIGLGATQVPTSSPAFVVVTQRPTTPRPTAVPATVEELQSPTAVPVTSACELGDAVDKPFFVSVRLGLRDCVWLAANPVFKLVMCLEGLEANDLCRFTCNNCGPTSVPVVQGTSAPTLSPVAAVVVTLAPTNAPTATPLVVTASPVALPTRRPVAPPTRRPTLRPTVTEPVQLATLQDLILIRSPASAGALNDNTSSQSQALAWLESDSTAVETLSEERLVQRWVMATLAFGADFESWDRNDSWLDSDDVCSWFGIACDNRGNAVSLNLQSNGLDGSLPSELYLLGDSLLTMNVGSNDLIGGFPSEFGRLVNLQTLRLNNNFMTGEIPTEIGNMESLVVLDFQRNRFSGAVPQSIIFLQNLEELVFNTNDMSGIVPQAVCGFANLNVLVLDCREIECDCWTQCYYQCGGDTGVVCTGNNN
jgi:hypothetical protein